VKNDGHDEIVNFVTVIKASDYCYNFYNAL